VRRFACSRAESPAKKYIEKKGMICFLKVIAGGQKKKEGVRRFARSSAVSSAKKYIEE
jgi:hypothetical protein